MRTSRLVSFVAPSVSDCKHFCISSRSRRPDPSVSNDLKAARSAAVTSSTPSEWRVARACISACASMTAASSRLSFRMRIV